MMNMSLIFLVGRYTESMLIEQLLFALGDAMVQIPPVYYIGIFLLVIVSAGIVTSIFHFHLQKYTFRDYKTGMMKLVYISGLGILSVIALILLGLIFGLS